MKNNNSHPQLLDAAAGIAAVDVAGVAADVAVVVAAGVGGAIVHLDWLGQIRKERHD